VGSRPADDGPCQPIDPGSTQITDGVQIEEKAVAWPVGRFWPLGGDDYRSAGGHHRVVAGLRLAGVVEDGPADGGLGVSQQEQAETPRGGGVQPTKGLDVVGQNGGAIRLGGGSAGRGGGGAA